MPFAGNQPMDPGLFGTDGTLASALAQAEPGPPKDEPISAEMDERLAGMTGEQYAEHFRRCLWALDYLSRNLPRVSDDARAFTMDRCMAASGVSWTSGVAWALQSAICQRMAANPPATIADEAIKWVADAVAYTVSVLGEDWRVVGVEHKNAAAIAYRLGKLDPAKAQEWYRYVSVTITNSFAVIRSEYEMQYTVVGIQANAVDFLDVLLRILHLPVEAFNWIVKKAGEWAQSMLEAIGEGLGHVGEGLASAIWKVVKPLLLPAALVGIAYVGWTQRHRIHAALTGRGGASVPGDGDEIEAETHLLPPGEPIRFRRR